MKRIKERANRWEADWPYWVGGLLLGFLSVGLMIVSGRPWGITMAFSYWGASVVQTLGGHPETWTFFTEMGQDWQGDSFLSYFGTWLNAGLVVGALLATLLVSQFRWRPVKSWRVAAVALAGGFLMGYGARLAMGCNIGAMVSGVSSLSVHGWLFALFAFLGVMVGSKVLLRYLR
ncbi:hypothetical protein SY88_19835 [Clostridiales bacterium PH28_bin88]|nr:hypothetical protein SY88_19835 [Clostridiales bacterium PH28_bin88]